MRGRSYTPSPPRGYGRRRRSPSPRGRYGGRGRDLPTSLLVRNLCHDCRPEDLRRPFGQFGAIKDIYLPKDYYTGEEWKEVGFEFIEDVPSLEEFQVILSLTHARQPRGFGFVQYVDPADAADAKYQMDGCVLQGRELTVVFAEENRKKPTDMRARERGSSGRFHDRRRSPPRYSRSPQYSRSPAPRHARSRSRSHDYSSPPPKQRDYSRSVSPRDRPDSRERSHPRQPSRGRSYSQSPRPNGSRSRSQSPARGPSRSRSRSPSNGRSPRQEVDRSPSE